MIDANTVMYTSLAASKSYWFLMKMHYSFSILSQSAEYIPSSTSCADGIVSKSFLIYRCQRCVKSAIYSDLVDAMLILSAMSFGKCRSVESKNFAEVWDRCFLAYGFFYNLKPCPVGTTAIIFLTSTFMSLNGSMTSVIYLSAFSG